MRLPKYVYQLGNVSIITVEEVKVHHRILLINAVVNTLRKRQLEHKFSCGAEDQSPGIDILKVKVKTTFTRYTNNRHVVSANFIQTHAAIVFLWNFYSWIFFLSPVNT